MCVRVWVCFAEQLATRYECTLKWIQKFLYIYAMCMCVHVSVRFHIMLCISVVVFVCDVWKKVQAAAWTPFKLPMAQIATPI